MDEKEILQILVEAGVLKYPDKEAHFNLQITRDCYIGTVKNILMAINECLSRVQD